MLAFSISRSTFKGVRSVKEQYILYSTFLVYLILLFTAVANHEPWMDEAQAWLLVKDVSLTDLFVKYLRYEGSPGLWHLILMLPAKIGLPYYTINILSATFSAIGVWLFMRYSPFRLLIKLLLPFSYFIFFQYGVVARSYCLIPPLLFLIAILYNRKLEKPFTFFLLLCLFANISAHTFLISCCLAFIHSLDFFKNWRSLQKPGRIKTIVAFAIFGAMLIAIVLMLLPPSDQIFARQANGTLQNFLYTPTMVAGSLTYNELGYMGWVHQVISAVIFIATLWWFFTKKTATVYLLPLVVILCFSAIVYRNVWHQGILFFLWMFVLWLSFDKDDSQINASFRKNVVYMIALVLGVQIFWTIKSFTYDLNKNYSASHQVASYIKENNLQNGKIFITGWKSIAVLPYFDRNIFYNLNNGSDKRFWFWSTNNTTELGVDSCVREKVQKDRPNTIIVSSHYIPRRKTISFEGYKYVRLFKGFLCWKTRRYEPESYLLFRREEKYLTKKTP